MGLPAHPQSQCGILLIFSHSVFSSCSSSVPVWSPPAHPQSQCGLLLIFSNSVVSWSSSATVWSLAHPQSKCGLLASVGASHHPSLRYLTTRNPLRVTSSQLLIGPHCLSWPLIGRCCPSSCIWRNPWVHIFCRLNALNPAMIHHDTRVRNDRVWLSQNIGDWHEIPGDTCRGVMTTVMCHVSCAGVSWPLQWSASMSNEIGYDTLHVRPHITSKHQIILNKFSPSTLSS